MLAVVGMLALGVVVGAVLLWPRGEVYRPAAAGQQDPTRLVSATLTRVQPLECEEADPGVPSSICIRVEARLADGNKIRFETTDLTGNTFRAGQQVTLSVLEREGQPPFYNIRDLERTRPMLVLVAVFMLAVVAFGRWQGLRSLIGLVLSFAVIIGFVVPAILRGRSPVAVALVGAMAIMLLSLYLSHGTGRKTTAAVVGTGLALVLTAALTAGFVAATSLTGLASEDALNASFLAGGLSFRGLLLAGIILGGLGVLDDVTMSQASLVFELRRADPAAALTRQGPEAGQSSAVERRPLGRASYALRGRLTPGHEPLVFDTVLSLHAPRLSHAAVGVNSASLPPEELPAGVSQAAITLRQLAATASRGNGSRFRRALAATTAHLDLQDPEQLDLLRQYGPFSTDIRIWVEDDPLPVIQATETLEGQQRVTYRLTSEEQDQLEANLQEAGLADVRLAPRRARADAWT
jgi:hypothetical protein